jgi:hypothetical protein
MKRQDLLYRKHISLNAWKMKYSFNRDLLRVQFVH